MSALAPMLAPMLDAIADGTDTDPQHTKAVAECAAYELRRLRKALLDIQRHADKHRIVPHVQYAAQRSASALAIERVP